MINLETHYVYIVRFFYIALWVTYIIMKSMTLSSVLLTMLFLFACKKENHENVSPAPEDTTVTLLTQGKYYYAQSDTAGMGAMFTDSLYYNEEDQLLKVVTSKFGGETIVYQFSYNSNGSLHEMVARGNEEPTWYLQHYVFSYGSGNRIDSITLIDSAVNAPYTMVPAMTYNAQGKLQSMKTVLRQEGASDITWNVFYSRSSNGTLDSFSNQKLSDGVQTFKRVVHPSATASVAGRAITRLELPYLFLLASRQDATLIRTSTVNLFLQQVLNPSDNLFRDGTLSYNNANPVADESYTHSGTLNADSTLHSYSYREGTVAAPPEKFYMKFAYITK